MTNEEKFKNSVRDLLHERRFAYDPDNWEEAKRVLDEKSKRKRGFFFLLFSGLGIGLLLLGYIFFSPVHNATAPVDRITDTRKTNGDRAEATLPSSLQQQKQQPQKTTVAPGSQPLAQHRNKNDKVSHAAMPHAVQQALSDPIPGKPGLKDRRTRVVQAETVLSKDLPAEGNRGQASASEKEENNKSAPPAFPVSETLSVGESKEKLTVGNEPVSRAETGLAAGAPVIEKTQNEAAAPPETNIEKDPVTMIPGPLLSIEKAPLAIHDSAAKNNLLKAQPDTSAVSMAQPVLQPAFKTGYFYVEAGTYFNAGWMYNGKREGAGFNPYAGAGYVTRATKKIHLAIGVYYTSLSYLDNGTKTIRQEQVIFGEQDNVTTVTPHTLNYLVAPARLHYFMNEKNALTLGYNFSYLLDVRSRVVTYTEQLNRQLDKKSSTTGGYRRGFRTFNSQLCVGYRRQLYGSLWLNAEVQLGLTDLRDNAFFGLRLPERTTGVVMSLTYDLLKK